MFPSWVKGLPNLSDALLDTPEFVRLQQTISAMDATSGTYSSPDARQLFDTASDDRRVMAGFRGALGRTGTLHTGMIAYAFPTLDFYRVHLDGLMAPIGCRRMAETSLSTGVRDTAPLPAGTSVLVYLPQECAIGVILGTLPTMTENGQFNLSDYIVQGSRGGLRFDRYYSDLIAQAEDGGSVLDFTEHRPFDAGGAGEWGKMALLGGGIFLDNFLAFLRMNEVCGLWLHYFDNLARLHGYNFDLRTAISELIARNDEGEGTHFSGFTGYPWEALGFFKPGVSAENARKENSEEDVLYKRPVSAYEPAEEDAMPFWRLREYRGYLGQGFLREVVAPSESSADSDTPQKLSDETGHIGLFREQIGYDGSYGVTSAHSVVIAKRCIIPIAKRIKAEEDAEGDGADSGYKRAGQHGDGDDHKVGNLPGGSEYANLRFHGALLDFHAHLFNWKALHPFHYHEQDFYLPEQQDVSEFTALSTPPTFSDLATKTWLSPPEPKTIKVDHRYGDTDYYETTSSISLLPDGGISIRGACGEEILLSGGNIHISAPGDVFLRPGRAAVTMAGDDIILKANKSIDLTSTSADVRLKAEKNLEALAGNGGQQGRMLFHNKASQRQHQYTGKVGEDISGSGIIFKADKSDILTYSANVYIRTGSESGDMAAGDIILDADKGKRDIFTISRKFNRHLGLSAADAFPADEKKTIVNYFDAYRAQIQTYMELEGGLYVNKDGIVARGSIFLVDGHVNTDKSKERNGLVGDLSKPSDKDKVVKILDDMKDRMSQMRKTLGQEYSTTLKKELYEGEDKVGSDDFEKNLAFSLRNEKQYGTNNFVLPEMYWQQLMRLIGATSSTWSEKPVEHKSEGPLMPYPGKKAWAQDNNFKRYSSDMTHLEEGYEKARSEGVYEEPEEAQSEDSVLDGNYPIIPAQ